MFRLSEVKLSVRRSRPAAPAGSGGVVLLVLLGLGSGSFAMLQSLVSPVLPTIQNDLHTTQSAVSWVLIAWLLSAAVATPILGRIGDMIGKQHALLVVLAAIAAGSLVCALAPTIGVLVAGRVVQGLGGAVYPIAFGIVRDEFPRERVPSTIGVLSAVIAVGGGVGTALAGPIVAGLGWRWLFWIPLVVIAATALLCRRFVPQSPVRSGGRINWPSAALLSIWLLALLLPVSEGQEWGWDAPATIALLAVAALGFLVWLIAEARSANPVIDLRMMRLAAVWTTNLVALFFGAAMFAVLTFLPQLLQTPTDTGYGFGDTVTSAGLTLLPMLAAMAIAGALSGPIRPVVGFKAQLALGSALLAVACGGFAFWTGHRWQLALAGALFGIGLGLAYAAMTSLVVAAVDPAQTGVATGMNTNIRNVGGAIGTAVVTAIVTSSTQPGDFPAAEGYRLGFMVLGAMAIAGVAVSALVPSRTDRR